MKLGFCHLRSFVFTPIWWLPMVVVLLGGCGKRTRSDFYRQQLAGEIRVLEDQLYDADYQNRVLQDKLELYEQRVESSRILTPPQANEVPQKKNQRHSSLGGALLPSPDPVPNQDTLDDVVDDGDLVEDASERPDDGFSGVEDPDEMELPSFDMGEPVEASEIEVGGAGPSEPTVDPNALKDPPVSPKTKRVPDSQGSADSQPSEEGSIGELPLPKPDPNFLPPPAPEPPGKSDLQVDPIIPGELKPPSIDGELEKPPGQILLPHNLNAPQGVPERLKIHKTRSLGNRQGQVLEGLTVVVGAVDHAGESVDLSKFDIAADMSVVVLDPTLEGAKARIGRWDFSSEQVASMVAEDPTQGFKIPLTWKSQAPKTDDVIVHVRLRGDVEEMRCDAKLNLQDRTASSAWTPRAKSTRK